MFSTDLQRRLILTSILQLVTSAPAPVGPASQLVYPVAKHSISLYPPKYASYGVWSADITVGSQVLRGALDTGSSDLWFLASNANCTEVFTLQPVPTSECGAQGPRYTVGPSFQTLPDVHLNASYAVGAEIYGPLGTSDMQFGGVSISNQEFSPAVYASIGGIDWGNVSGIIGLAYPAQTSAFPGTDPSQDVLCPANATGPHCGPILYPPLMTTIFNEGLSQPFFAFALSRSRSDGGLMSIGGIPDPADERVNVTTGGVATVGLLPFSNSSTLTYYIVQVDGVQYSGSSSDAGNSEYIVDTGTISSFVPAEDAKAINALFDPPATFNNTLGVYQVNCSATVPQISFVMQDQVFPVNPKDLIEQAVPGEEGCTSMVQPASAQNPPLLGASFLKSVLAVFDVGGTALTFASRPYYQDS